MSNLVPSEDMCLLAMNTLYSSNHKKEKVSIKFVEESICEASTSPSEVKVKNVQ